MPICQKGVVDTQLHHRVSSVEVIARVVVPVEPPKEILHMIAVATSCTLHINVEGENSEPTIGSRSACLRTRASIQTNTNVSVVLANQYFFPQPSLALPPPLRHWSPPSSPTPGHHHSLLQEYFHNATTNQTTWDRPTAPAAPKAAPPLPSKPSGEETRPFDFGTLFFFYHRRCRKMNDVCRVHGTSGNGTPVQLGWRRP